MIPAIGKVFLAETKPTDFEPKYLGFILEIDAERRGP